MTDAERKQIFMDGLKRKPVPHGRGGFIKLSKEQICGGYSEDYWQARMDGERAWVALEKEAGPYLYPEGEGFLYGEAS